MNLPKNLYFTGAPGSMWSTIARVLEKSNRFNASDRHWSREVKNKLILAAHEGMYFGQVDGFPAVLDTDVTDTAYEHQRGCKVLKSHSWTFMLDEIKAKKQWIMMVYRPSSLCVTWWNRQGGFCIDYPSYETYKDTQTMLYQIQLQNQAMMRFAGDNDLAWRYYTPEWIEETFGEYIPFKKRYEITNALAEDTLVAIYKPEEDR